MSVIGKLFGGSTPRVSAPPPAPKISDASGEGAVREFRARTKRKKGVDDTILSSSLGGTQPSTGTVTRAALGG